MALSREDILKVAKLSKLKLSEEEIKKFYGELNEIMGYIDNLDELNTDNIEPLIYINEEVNNYRKDEVGISIDREKVLLNAPQCDEETIIVPRVIGE